MPRLMMLLGLTIGTAEAAPLACDDVAVMVKGGVPHYLIMSSLQDFERGPATADCIAGLPAPIRDAYIARPEANAARAIPRQPPPPAPAADASSARPTTVVCMGRDQTTIEYNPYAWLVAEEERKAQLLAPNLKTLPVAGYVMVRVQRSTNGAAHTEYVTVVFKKDGAEVGRLEGERGVPDWSLEIFLVPATLSPPFEVHALDSVPDQRCSAIVDAEGSLSQIQ